jgi:transcriptional regulator with XRE-family HTH domain
MHHRAKFASALSRLRREAELSQEELAHRADLHRTYISQLERGLKSPTLDVMLALAAALRMPARDFFSAICTEDKR